MNYKKIFKNKKMRFKILSLLRFIPDKQMLILQYFIKHQRVLNLKNPKRYTEKIQWYKLNYRNALMQQCADKYTVREYVKEKGLESILNQLYGVFETPEQISFDTLPDRFIMKLSNGSSTNFVCDDKSNCSIETVQKKFKDFIAQAGSSAGREWVYKGLKPVIVAEQLLEDPEQVNGALCDYKILCFNGKPEYIICVTGRYTNNYRHIVYDSQWRKQEVIIGESCANGEVAKPVNFDEMMRIAHILSEDFPAARVDLYSIGGKIYFGEITFFPWSGYMEFKPDEFDYELGSKFVLLEK